MENVLEVKGLTKLYKNNRGITDIAFEVHKGDIFGFLGPNGAGKTTTMKAVTGLCSINSGEVKIFGYNIFNQFEKAMEKVGCIIETAVAYEYMSAYRNLEMAARFYDGIGHERINEVLDIVGLEIGAAIIVSIFQNNLGIRPVNGADFPVFILGFFTNLFMPLFVFLAVVDLFAEEFSDKTLKIVLLRPITRFKVFVSKILSVGIYIVVSLALVLIVSTIMSLFLAGISSMGPGLGRSLTAYFAAIIPMLVLGIAAAFIAQLFKSGSGALAFSIFLFIALAVISLLFPSISRLFLTSYTDWHNLWTGNVLPVGQIINAFMFMLSYSIIFFGTGFYLFDRKEL